jgi:hypothetical protein
VKFCFPEFFSNFTPHSSLFLYSSFTLPSCLFL